MQNFQDLKHDGKLTDVSKECANILVAIFNEVKRAETKHPAFVDNLPDALIVINEELGEASQAYIDATYHKGVIENIRKELIETAATIMRTLLNFDELAEDIATRRAGEAFSKAARNYLKGETGATGAMGMRGEQGNVGDPGISADKWDEAVERFFGHGDNLYSKLSGRNLGKKLNTMTWLADNHNGTFIMVGKIKTKVTNEPKKRMLFTRDYKDFMEYVNDAAEFNTFVEQHAPQGYYYHSSRCEPFGTSRTIEYVKA